MQNQNDNENFLPDIDDYLESVGHNAPVGIAELDGIVDHVVAHSRLDRERAAIIIRAIFEEIRNAMLRGEKVTIRDLGVFYISSPKFGNKKQTFPKFKPYKSLLKMLNHDR